MTAPTSGAGHKYHARRTEYAGQFYPSAAEARRAMELDALKAAGEIAGWGRGRPIELVPKPHRVTYVPDFIVWTNPTCGGCEGFCINSWLEDIKGVETPVFKLKRRLLAWRYPTLELRVLKVR